MINRLLLLFAFVLLGGSAQAADFYWDTGTGTGVNRKVADPVAHCKKIDDGEPYYTDNQVTFDGGNPATATHAVCRFSANGYSPYSIMGYNYYKYACGAATPYFDAATGSCTATPPPPPPMTCPVPRGTTFKFGFWTGWGPKGAEHSDLSQMDGYPKSSAECNLEGDGSIDACYSIYDAAKGKDHFYCVFTGVSAGTVADGTYQDNLGAPTGPPPAPGTRTDLPPMKAPPSNQCPRGSVMAGYNSDGIPMCVGTGTAPPTPPPVPPTTTKTTQTTNADGSVTTTTTTVQTNKDGSTSTTTVNTTKMPDGSESSSGGTVVSENSAGGAGRTDAPPSVEQANLCKQNPTLSICRESSVTGTCGQIACMGDAIQCATLRAAAAMECKQRTDETAIKDSASYKLGEGAAGGNDPLASTLPTVKNASVVNMGSMDNNGWLGAGAAFDDVTVTVQGKAITVPLNKWSGYLVALRYALMVVAMLVSFKMLSGVILKD